MFQCIENKEMDHGMREFVFSRQVHLDSYPML